MQRFRIDARAFFLTYPKCDLTRHDALEMLRAKLVGSVISNYCIAQEFHEDGEPHLHCLLVLEKKKTVASANYFDLAHCHGNYQACKNRIKVFDYITKCDATPLTNMDAESLKVKSLTRVQIGKRILAGEELKDLVEEYPQYIFGFKRLQDDLKAYQDAKVVYRSLGTTLENPWGFLIYPKGGKRRHYWIWSNQPNKGKTTWARSLESKYGAYIKSSDFTYWNITGKETIVILDDYNVAGLRFHTLNQLCDGSYEARVFMGGNKRVRPDLVIVLSNLSLRELYPFKYDLLEARFIVKELL